MPRTLNQAHRLLAAGLALFILSHLTIHSLAIFGPERHLAVLSAVQGIYRNPIGEPLLIAAILSQIVIGARLLARRWTQPDKGFWGWAQLASGAYLALFLVLHTTAALSTRNILGIDTNFYWAASTLVIEPFKFAFFPYYAFAILSVFTHLAAAVRFGWAERAGIAPGLLVAAGAVVSVLILATFSGGIYKIELPAENVVYFERLGL